MELTQVRMLVTNFTACYRFYRDVIGLEPQFEAEQGPYAKLVPPTGSAGIALQDRAQMAQLVGELADVPSGYRSLVVLRVDDLERSCEQITSRGALLVNGPVAMTERMRVAHLKDPEGNLVELQQWLIAR